AEGPPDFGVGEMGKNRLGRGAAASGRAALLFEAVRLGIDLQAGVGQTEAARESADGDEDRRVLRVFRALDRNREDVVLLEQLDRALRPPRRRRDEQRR